ncbi:MAG: G5 domain-containing protein [Oscillospiraceae bacterium]|nr:G5 domain-containing protein [Oscillospiraceae bacterium]
MVKLTHRVKAVLCDNRHRLLCMAVCIAILGVMHLGIYSLLNIVTVQDGTTSKTVISLLGGRDHFLNIAGFAPDEDDQIIYTTFPDRYTNITIRQVIHVPITVDGGTINSRIYTGTVKNCLMNAGVMLGEHDYTEPSLNTPVDENTKIRVYRVEYRDTQYEEAIPYETEYKEHSLVWRFKKRQYVLTAGSEGKNLVTHRERYVDGQMESSLITKVETVREPVNEVVLRYKNTPISPLEAPEGVTVTNNVPSSYRTCYTMSATGYTAKRGRGASRLGLYCGTVAVNPNLIPYGTKLYITSADGQFVYGFAIATDTGSAMMANPYAIDLFYDTYKESALNWRNEVLVYVL